MVNTKERLEEIGRKFSIGECDCINAHHKDEVEYGNK